MNIKHLFSKANSINSSVYVIAEAGVNHNGDMDMAIQLIKKAKQAGADAVKFQTFTADEIVTKTSPKAIYQNLNTDAAESQYEMLKKLELGYEDFLKLKKVCEQEHIEFLSTPYNITDIDLLARLDVAAIKVASAIAVEPEFLTHAALMKKPIILSTGMCTLEEISDSVLVLRNNNNNKILLMQCTTNYPSELKDSNISAMKNMGKHFNLPYGYSDHTQSDISVIAAVANGACMVEKHFTLDKSLPGPDHSSSCEPAELKSYIKNIKDTLNCLGDGKKKPVENELVNKAMMRRGLVARKKIIQGTVLTKEHIAYKRPETKLKPSELYKIIGKKILKTVEKNKEIKLEYF